MSEQEMQELQNRVVESIQDYFDSYDWMESLSSTSVSKCCGDLSVTHSKFQS